MSSLWNALGVDALAEHVGGVVNRASELAKDVITDDIDDEDEGEVQSRALFSTAGERDEALQAAESAELQIASISQQYRQLLLEREGDVSRLKEELHATKAQLALRGSSAEGGETRSAGGAGSALEGGADDDDLGHVLSVQKKLNKVGVELERTKNELESLKKEQALAAASGPADHQQVVAELARVRGELNLTIDQHQGQLSELQDMNAEALAEAHTTESTLRAHVATAEKRTEELEAALDRERLLHLDADTHGTSPASGSSADSTAAAAAALQDEMEAMRKSNAVLEKKCNVQLKKIATLTAEKKKHRAKIAELESAVALSEPATPAVDGSGDDLRAAEGERDRFAAELATVSNEHAARLSEMRDALTARVASLEAENTTLAESAEVDQNTVVEAMGVLKEQLSTHKESLAKRAAELEVAQAAVAERDALTARVASLEAENTALAESAEGDQNTVSEAMAVLKEQLSAHKESLAKRTAELEIAQAAATNGAGAVAKATMLQDELAALSTTTRSYQEEMTSKVARCKALETALAEKEALLASALASKQEGETGAASTLQSVQARCDELERSIKLASATATGEASQLHARIAEFEEREAAHQSALAASEVQLAQATERIATLQAAAAATAAGATEETAHLRARVTELEERDAAHQSAVAASNAQLADAATQIADLHATAAITNGAVEENARLEAAVVNLRSDIMAAESRVSTAQNAALEATARLATERSALESEVGVARDELTAVVAELENLKTNQGSERESAAALVQAQARVVELTQLLEVRGNESTAAAIQSQAQIVSLRAHIEELCSGQSTNQQASEDLAGAQVQLAAVTAELDELRKAGATAKTTSVEEAEALQTLVKELEARVDASNAAESDAQARCAQVQAQWSQVEAKLLAAEQHALSEQSDSDARATELAAQVETLQSQHDVSESAASAAFTQSQTRVAQLEAHIRDLQVGQDSDRQVASELSLAQTRASELELLLEQRHLAVTKLEVALGAATADSSKTAANVTAQAAEVAALHAQLSATQEQLVSNNQNEIHLQQSLQELEANLDHERRNHAAAVIAQATALEAVDKLKNDLTNASAMSVSKDADISRLESELAATVLHGDSEMPQFGALSSVPNGGGRATSAAAAFLTGGPGAADVAPPQTPTAVTHSVVSRETPPTTPVVSGDDSGTVVSLRIERDRMRAQLEKLQNHLMSVNDQHTEEVLQHEEQVALYQAETEVAQSQVEQVTVESEASIKTLESRVKRLEATAARALQDHDRATKELATTQAENARLATGLANLEEVLQEFEDGKASAIQAAVQAVQSECDQLRQELQQALADVEQAAADRQAHRRETEAFAAVQQDANVSAGLCKSLQADVERMQRDLQGSQAKLAEALTASPAVVDKQLIKNMIVQYVEHSGEQQKQVMNLLANMLDFDEGDRYAVGLRARRGFMSQLLAGPSVKPDTPGKAPSKTFASDLVEFMMTEAKAQQTPGTAAAAAPATPYPATNSQPHLKMAQQHGRMSSDGSADGLSPFKLAHFTSAQTP